MQLQHKYFYKRLRNKNSDNIDVTELLRESIYSGESKYLSYYVNVLIKRQLVEEIFAILRNTIFTRTFQRRDSGYDLDLENEDQHSLCELEYESDSKSAEETEQYSTNEAIKIIIQALINAGVNIGTYKYETVETLLHSASSVGNIEIVEFLIEKGVDVDVKNNRGATALHLAVISGHLEVVKALIDAKAKIEEKNNEGLTPLQLAVSCENEDIVEYLLKKNANLNTTCPFVDRSTDDIGELGDNLYIQAKELEGTKYTPLQLAAFLGNIDIINLLINNEADINAVCEDKKYSCLHMAVFGITYCVNREIREEGYLKVLNFLLSNSSSLINSRDHEGNTPLHRAISANHEETIKVLLEYRASLLEFRKGGYTVFHDAVAKGNLDIVKLLLDNSDEQAKLINCVYIPVEENGDDICLQLSPLRLAISAYISFLNRKEDSLESFNIIQYLLSYSTLDINIKDFNGDTPLHCAIKYIEDDELALALINELLAAKNINLFIKDNEGKTPFYYAIASNRAEILQKLIHHKYYHDDSLLHLAAENGDVKAVEYLIEDQKFDVNLQNDSEITPLQLAASKGSIDVVCVLIKKGAVDISAQPAAYRAIFRGKLDMADLLLTSFTNSKERVNYCFCMSMTTIEQIYACDSIDENKSQENVQAKQIHINRLIRAICHLVNSYPELDINIFDDQKRIALHRVIKSKLDIDNKLKLLETLLKRKDINPFIKDAENKTPIDYYIEQENYSYILDQYAKIQADRNTSIENYNAKKYVVSAIALCAINVVFIEMYINQYSLESFIPDTQYLGLMFITNIVACICCVIISKSIGKSIEEKYKSKVFGLFENNNKIPSALEETNSVTLSSQRGGCLIGG